MLWLSKIDYLWNGRHLERKKEPKRKRKEESKSQRKKEKELKLIIIENIETVWKMLLWNRYSQIFFYWRDNFTLLIKQIKM